MPFVLGLDHLALGWLDLRGLLVEPLLGRPQRLIEFLSRALLMPVGTENRCAAIVGMACARVAHALEAVFLDLVARSVHAGPRGRRQGVLDLRGAPVHQDLAFCRLDDNPMPGVLGSGPRPRSTRDL